MVTISITADDSISGVAYAKVKEMDLSWQSWNLSAGTDDFPCSSDDGEKRIIVKVVDQAGNSIEVENTIILDTVQPDKLSILINSGDTYTTSREVVLTLNAQDLLSGLDTLSFSLDGVDWTDDPDIIELKSIHYFSDDWNYKLKGTEGMNTIYFMTTDKAGNIASAVSDSIILDTLPPYALKISINDNAEKTDSTKVTLELNAVDDGSGIDRIAFSTDNSTWDEWMDYKETIEFTLPEGDGVKTVYFKVMDKVGHESIPVYAEIVLDTAIPVPDTDGDGVKDDVDAFPNDPAASIDTDSDGYPDSWNPGSSIENSTTGLVIDQYPSDPTKHDIPASTEKTGDENSVLWIVAVIVIVVIALLITFLFYKRLRPGTGRKGSGGQLEEIKQEIIDGRNREVTGSQLRQLYEQYPNVDGLKEETEEYIKNIIDEKE
jgi:hypothetical protein